MGTNFNKWSGLSAVIIMITILITQFQNCAPVQEGELAADDEVQIIENWADFKIAFIEELIEIQSTANQISIDGLCAGRGHSNEITWSLVDTVSGATVMDNQASSCERGGFHFVIHSLNQLECDRKYRLTALRDGERDLTLIQKRCFADLAIEVGSLADNQSRCYFELNHEPMNCAYRCYRQGKVVSRQDLSLEECSEMQLHIEI